LASCPWPFLYSRACRVGLRLMGGVCSLLAMELHRGVARVVRRPQVWRRLLRPEALLTGPRLDQRAIDRKVLIKQDMDLFACSKIRRKKACAISPSSSRSRFLVKTVAIHSGHRSRDRRTTETAGSGAPAAGQAGRRPQRPEAARQDFGGGTRGDRQPRRAITLSTALTMSGSRRRKNSLRGLSL
jgi:hypothetical protein